MLRGGSQDTDGNSEEFADRMEQIEAAIRRREAKEAAGLAAGEDSADSEKEETRRLTVEEERTLGSLLAQLPQLPLQDEDSALDSVLENELAAKSREYRINRTLEFCPDGVLAREIISEMCANGTVPGAQTWNVVIDAFARRDALDDALDVFRDMQKARVAATDATYDILAQPAMRRGEFRFVETLYHAKEMDHEGTIGAESLAILLEAYANGRPPQSERAVVAFRSEVEYAKENGMSTSIVATNAVLRALRRVAGTNQTCELCWEYGIDPVGML